MRHTLSYISLLAVIALLTACSTTKHLPEGEVLYTGQKPIIWKNQGRGTVADIAIEEVEAALATAPNNSFMGSSTKRIPFPLGLWVYNGFGHYEKGFGRWFFEKFGSTPVLVSTVNPDIRQKAAQNLLRDYGYFNGWVSHQIFTDPKDSLKAKIQYTVDMRNPYLIDTVFYQGFSKRTLNIMNRARRRSLISPGEQFNVLDIDAERTRISTLLRNVGCYYFQPDYLTFQADTTLVRGGHVAMRMVPVEGMPGVAEKPFNIGRKRFILMGRNGEMPNDSMVYRDLTIYYHDKLRVRPNMLYRWLNYNAYRRKRAVTDSTGISRRRAFQNLYSLNRETRVRERVANLDIFRYMEMQYAPRDSAFSIDTLDLSYVVQLDKPFDAELDFNLKVKTNNQMGPGASFTVTKKNVFGGGESWNVKLDGSYEWQTGPGSTKNMNSYEWGLSTSLVFPRVVFPRMGQREYDFPATTTFKLYSNQINRAKYYKILGFGGSATYNFDPRPTRKHSFTPFKLTFNWLREMTDEFKQATANMPSVELSLQSQFIPAMEYTFTYDNLKAKNVKHPIWWQTTVASAGNLTSLGYAAFGKSLSTEGKELLGVPFAQYLKVNSEIRYHYKIDKNQSLAARLGAGIIWSYGNATSAPYTESFYVGGANSVRAFTARSIGPGGYVRQTNDENMLLANVGDIRFEANLEYRARLIADLHGAVFLDAGNIWLLRPTDDRPNGNFKPANFFKELALGTGVGLRYDMDFLVFRLDLGIALHNPNLETNGRYYNIPSFKDGLALQFAIGYPF